MRAYLFFLPQKRLNKIAFTPEDFHKIWVYPWRIWVLPLMNIGVPLENFVKIKAPPPKNFTLPLKKSSIFITYPWRIPLFLSRGVGGTSIKCNSPVVFAIPSNLMCSILCSTNYASKWKTILVFTLTLTLPCSFNLANDKLILIKQNKWD